MRSFLSRVPDEPWSPFESSLSFDSCQGYRNHPSTVHRLKREYSALARANSREVSGKVPFALESRKSALEGHGV